jgi:hypothetical protein
MPQRRTFLVGTFVAGAAALFGPESLAFARQASEGALPPRIRFGLTIPLSDVTPSIEVLRAEQPTARWIRVGKKAEQQLARVGIAAFTVRRPANGGARAFANGMAEIAARHRAPGR